MAVDPRAEENVEPGTSPSHYVERLTKKYLEKVLGNKDVKGVVVIAEFQDSDEPVVRIWPSASRLFNVGASMELNAFIGEDDFRLEGEDEDFEGRLTDLELQGEEEGE